MVKLATSNLLQTTRESFHKKYKLTNKKWVFSYFGSLVGNNRRLGFGLRNSRRPFSVYSQKRWKEVTEDIQKNFIASIRCQDLPTSNKIYAEIKFYYYRHEPDLDSWLKIVLDALEGFLWKNDRQIIKFDHIQKFRVPYKKMEGFHLIAQELKDVD